MTCTPEPWDGLTWPRIGQACFAITIDNGGINRGRSVQKWRRDFVRWITKRPSELLRPIEDWLTTKSAAEIEAICCGGQGEPEQVAAMADAPAFADDLLTEYFEEVC